MLADRYRPMSLLPLAVGGCVGCEKGSREVDDNTLFARNQNGYNTWLLLKGIPRRVDLSHAIRLESQCHHQT